MTAESCGKRVIRMTGVRRYANEATVSRESANRRHYQHGAEVCTGQTVITLKLKRNACLINVICVELFKKALCEDIVRLVNN